MTPIQFAAAASLAIAAIAPVRSEPATTPTALTNGFSLTPAGAAIPLAGDMPTKMILTKDGAKLIVETTGYHDDGLFVIGTASNKIVQSDVSLQKLWPGLAFSPDGTTLYAAGGKVDSGDRQKTRRDNPWGNSFKRSLVQVDWDPVKLAGDPRNVVVGGWDDTEHFAAGAAVTPDGALYMLDQDHDQVVRLAGNPLSVVARLDVGYRPYSIVVSPDAKTLAVSNWGGKSVSLLDVKSFTQTAQISVGSHPNELVYARDGRLFVACSGSNTVAVIRGGHVVETIDTALRPASPVGSTPDAVAVAPDGSRLFVANADNDDVAVVDIAGPASRVLGFIPTGWYPSALAVSADGKTLYVGTAKGLGPLGKNFPPRSLERHTSEPAGITDRDYVGSLLQGSVNAVPMPSDARLAAYTRQVFANTPYTRTPPRLSATGLAVLRSGKIKHVLFIVRENRTYDQVLGDIGRGNSDPSICIFGKGVTPNAHALANRYVLFDNLYCSGEVSEDGHQWCDGAYATDFIEKAWVSSYSSRGEPDADERFTASPAGYLWDDCARHDLSYFSYGEMATYKSTPDAPPTFTGEKDLIGHNSPEVETVKWGEQHDTARAAFFVRDLKKAETTGKWPNFVVMWLGEDHTQGLKAGAYTPQAMVAGNDVALGQVVDAVSHSRFWKDTAIFVIEDDAQNGPDHVDAHRTVGLIISPYVKQGIVDSTQYTTTSFDRTMEMALGLPPMTQFDAGAMPLTNDFTSTPDEIAYTGLPAQIDLEARNPSSTPGAQASARLDLSGPDKADPDTLNRILWSALRPGQPMPPPVRRFGFSD